MVVEHLKARDFRCYERAELRLGHSLTVVHGPNGAGKTNLLEALYFGCTGRSCRTTNEREIVRFGQPATRVSITGTATDGHHQIAVGFEPGQPKRMQFDGADVERLLEVDGRPLVSVFLPDRLELIKGAPALRRAHLDSFVTALWPSRAATRRAYAQTLAQRNALIARIRTGAVSPASLDAWDAQLARHAIAVMADRSAAADLISGPFVRLAADLGLDGTLSLAYRPRSKAHDSEALIAELGERRASDLERGFSGHGPHRDDVATLRDGRELRAYGSQGQQRLALLAMLLAEREAIAAMRPAPPLMLLDDVMSELDRDRRTALVDVLRTGGQSVITTTDLEHVPSAQSADVVRVAVLPAGVILEVAA